MGLLQNILYFLLAIWILRILLRLLLPVIFKQLLKKVQKQAQASYTRTEEQSREEGAIHVDHVPPKRKSRKAEQAGEFVDFEEIKQD
ncbi:MAG: hypothetical protein RI924_492 [Bacteroidota bacterium]|jgi:beta-lactamase regulating signal transducer with metallopeptidase domain